MRTRIILLAAGLTISSALSFGQGFTVLINGCNNQLSQTCGGQDWYPEGTTIYIMQDLTNNGPSGDDVPPSVGSNGGQVNFSSFTTNGVSYCGLPGTFYTDPGFQSNGYIPANAHYYLVIYCPSGGAIHLYSNTFSPISGPQEWTPTWTCTPCGMSADHPTALLPEYRLDVPYPNPFNSETTIRFELPRPEKIRVAVFDVTGAEVMVLMNDEATAGEHAVCFAGGNLSSGIYFVQMEAAGFRQTRKLVLLK